MTEKATKKVIRTTKEEFIADIEETKQPADIQPIAPQLEVSPIRFEIDDDDYDYVPPPKNERKVALQWLDDLSEDSRATIIIKRKPDLLTQKTAFIEPCSTSMKIDSYPWQGQDSTEEHLYNAIVSNYGGGNYHFEIRHGKGFTGLTWEATLADSPEWRKLKRREVIDEEKESDETTIKKVELMLQTLLTEREEQKEKGTLHASDRAADVEMAKIAADTQVTIARIDQETKEKQMNNKSLIDVDISNPYSLLAKGVELKHDLLINTALGKLKDKPHSATWTDLAFDVFSTPEKFEQAQSMLVSGLSVFSKLFSRQQQPSNLTPNVTQQTKTPPVANYNEWRKQSKKPTLTPEKETKKDA